MARDHVALVTGGSRGIGAEIARALARSGAAVVVGARTVDACQVLCDELGAQGARAFPVPLDVTSVDSVRAAVEVARAAVAAIGPIDWLVNNAGIAVSAPLAYDGQGDAGEDLYARHMDVNFHGARRVTEALLGDMLERGYGRVVNVASSAGLRGYAYVSAYCASKHALVGYTRAAALELGDRGVAFRAVCPHYVDSPMLEAGIERIVARTGKSAEEARRFFEGQNPGGRLVSMAEVAAAVRDALAGDGADVVVELDGSGAA